MKKNIILTVGISALISIIIALLLINEVSFKGTSASVTTNESNNLTKDNPMGDGVENIHLQFFLQKNGESEYPEVADRSYIDLINYVDENGVITNKPFMDTFLFIPSGAYFSSGNFIETLQESHIDTYVASEIGEMKRINNFIQDEINNVHGTRQKLNVIMTIALPQNFDCKSSRESSKDCLTRFIDKSINSFNAANLNNLRLIGFYWDEERIKPTIADENNAIDFNDIVHSKGYKTIWIPYIDHFLGYNNNNYTPQTKSGTPSYIEGSYTKGYTYGFDFVSLQSNYYFEGDNSSWISNFGTENGRLTVTAAAAKYYKYGVELEISSNATWSWYDGTPRDTYCQRYKSWLNQAATSGYNWDKTVKTYYMFQTFSNNYNQVDTCFAPTRYIYDSVYYYSQQNLSNNFINTVNSYLNCNTTTYPRVSNNDNDEAFPASINQITFDANDAKGAETSTITTTYVKCGDSSVYKDAAATTTSSVPNQTNNGKKLLGWYTAINGGTKVLNADGSIATSVAGYTKNNKWHTYYNKTLYAHWSDEENTVEEQQPENTVEEQQPENIVEKQQPENTVEEQQPENTVEEQQPENTVEEQQPENTKVTVDENPKTGISSLIATIVTLIIISFTLFIYYFKKIKEK